MTHSRRVQKSSVELAASDADGVSSVEHKLRFEWLLATNFWRGLDLGKRSHAELSWLAVSPREDIAILSQCQSVVLLLIC